jgi:hypothetical protein
VSEGVSEGVRLERFVLLIIVIGYVVLCCCV